MSSLCKISENGECVSCKKNVGNAHVTCFFCQESFHAFNCSAPQSICTSTFHGLYKPLNAKTGVNADRPGMFLFTCDICLTKYEVNKAESGNNKIEKLQKQVNNLEKGLMDIKDLLTSKPAANTNPVATTGARECADDLSLSSTALPSGNGITTNNVWSSCVSKPGCDQFAYTSNFPLPDANPTSVSTNGLVESETNKPSTSVLIIEKFDDEVAEKESLNKVEEVIVNQNIDIENSFKNQLGKTVIICKSSDQRDDLKSKIESAIPTLPMKAVGNLNKSIVVAGFNNNYTDDNIVDTLIAHNEFISSFIALKSSTVDNHIVAITVKPLKKNADLCQVILKVSSSLRELIAKHGDKLRVGMKRCPVYERHFVKRCFGCQHFGHFHAKCPTKTVFCCSNCAGDHETHKCQAPVSDFKCVNCMRAGRSENINHTASSLSCLMFIQELNKLKNRSTRWSTKLFI